MASMPLIDDDMVELFRRTGNRRSSYSNLGTRLIGDTSGAALATKGGNVVLQGTVSCEYAGQVVPCPVNGDIKWFKCPAKGIFNCP